MGAFCLATYLFGGAKIVPALLALGAQLEGSHTVLIGGSGGTFDLLLHHEAKSWPSGGWVNHRHGLVSKLFCAFASSENFDPDHVLHFPSGFFSESTSVEMAFAAASTCLFNSIQSVLWSLCPAPADRFDMKLHPPARAPGHLPALRVTVLVI